MNKIAIYILVFMFGIMMSYVIIWANGTIDIIREGSIERKMIISKVDTISGKIDTIYTIMETSSSCENTK